MADTLEIFDFAPSSSGKSIPGILNRKRKPQNHCFVVSPLIYFMKQHRENPNLLILHSLLRLKIKRTHPCSPMRLSINIILNQY